MPKLSSLARFLLPFSTVLALAAQVSVVQNRYNEANTGANLHETILTPFNVNVARFGKLYNYSVDGAVYAQPLYMPSVSIAGRFHNVVYVATMEDKLYAFDADKSGDPLWFRDFTNPAAGVTPVPITDVTDNINLNVVGNAGIMG